ncbi:MAG: GNAT family N-acetyltransferase [Gemmatimonadaceae bacterium]
MRIRPASSPADLDLVRQLFLEYQAQLGVDLSYQGFGTELLTLPGAYAAPSGRLLLAEAHGHVLGCAALRDAGSSRAEMKRLFVRPEGRGSGVGLALVERLVAEARAAGYAELVLDTLASMGSAHRLYERAGFDEIAPYHSTALPGTRYFRRVLNETGEHR